MDKIKENKLSCITESNLRKLIDQANNYSITKEQVVSIGEANGSFYMVYQVTTI